jgi:hypothetical protein
MKQSFLVLSLVFTGLIAFAQKQQFVCPIENGQIIEFHFSEEGKPFRGALFKQKGKNVLNIRKGEVVAVDTVQNVISISIKSGDYFFSYNGLEEINVAKGQIINAGRKLGKLKKDEQLSLLMNFKDEIVKPTKYLKCQVVHQYQ